jgi:hypothetical protein
MVFPVYHVFADIAEWKDGKVVSSRSTEPLAVETLVITTEGTLHLLAANLTPEPRQLTLDAFTAGEVTRRRLNAETADRAAFNSGNFRTQAERMTIDGSLHLTLAPFEVVRLDGPRRKMSAGMLGSQ